MKKYYCYILFSPSLNKFYTGSTSNSITGRLDQHLRKFYGKNRFTAAAVDWNLYLDIPCTSYKQAILIEKHVKRMKSRKYIENLKRYPEMIEKLKTRFS